ncbi:MAG: hypothetical protein ACLSWS_14250 [Faecalispora jeddahensis]|jgi:hypothetical protein
MNSMYFTRRNQILLDAVRSAENAAIQLRQYAAAVLEPVQTVPGDAFSDSSQAAVVEITPEGWLAVSLPGMMPRRDDADRSRFLAGLLRDSIRRAFPENMTSRSSVPACWCMSTSMTSTATAVL